MREEELKKILIINLGGIGDLLLCLPAIKALTRHFPDAEVDMLAAKRVEELTKAIPFIKKAFFLYVNKRDGSFLRGAIKNLRTFTELQNKKFDLAINMRTIVSKKGALKIKFLMDRIRPRFTMGRDTDGLGGFFDLKVPETLVGKKSEMEYDCDTVRALGTDKVDKIFELNVRQDCQQRVDSILKSTGLFADDVLIGVHPGGMPSHRLPIEKLAAAIDELSKKTGAKFVVTADKDEAILSLRLQRSCKAKLIDLSEKLSIMDLFALIKRCDCFISNDTGPMHIAAVLKTPLVAIFGPGDLSRYDPRVISNNAIVLYNKEKCSPCYKYSCNHMSCFVKINPDEIVSAVSGLLKKHV
ncbi:MAG: glycosyltransferase family 9 protein [Candidatus Omnitrophica bacterium]|nr:glycosyltransferase family 9 protein [Candidatus Omnitrophota bacterium]